MQVTYKRTVLGYWNIRKAGSDEIIATLSPAEFSELFPNVSKKAAFGCDELDPSYAKSLVA